MTLEAILDRFRATHEERIADIFLRVATLAPEAWRDEALRLLNDGVICPSGQILRGAGISGANLMSCYVEAPELHESAGDIAETIARYTSVGAGVGMNLTRWSRDKPDASIADVATEIGQRQERLLREEGIRRTASLITCEPADADVLSLARALASVAVLRHLNLTVLLTDADVTSIEELTLAGEPHPDIIQAMWETGLPCLAFIDTINREDPGTDWLDCSNPCGEQYLPVGAGCNLGSINLAACATNGGLDLDLVGAAAGTLGAILDTAVVASYHPSAAHAAEAIRSRRIGVGVLGYDTLLQRLRIPYGHPDGLELLTAALTIARRAVAMAHGDRTHITAIAPTGGISRLLRVSPGIEACVDRSLPDWPAQLAVLTAAQGAVDNAVSKTVLLPPSATPRDVSVIVVSAWRQNCKGVSVFRYGCRS